MRAIRAIIRLFAFLCVMLLGLFALGGFILSVDTSVRVAGVMGWGGIALLLSVIGVIGVRALWHRGPRDLTPTPPVNSPSTRPRMGAIRAIIRLFGFLEIVLAMLLFFFALGGFMMSDDTGVRVATGVFGGLALLLAMFGVRNMRHRSARDFTFSPPTNNPTILTTANALVGGTFVREADLENCLVRNWDRLDFGTPLEFVAQQVSCGELGIIDVLARDRVTRDYVVVELKKGQADDVVFGQLARYMGGIERDRATIEGVGVRGIIVSKTISSRLRAAASVNPKVGLRQYVLVSNGESRTSLAKRLNCSPVDLLLLPGTGEQLGCMCGHENVPNARYCARCGNQVSSRATTYPQCVALVKRRTSPLVGALALLSIIAAYAGSPWFFGRDSGDKESAGLVEGRKGLTEETKVSTMPPPSAPTVGPAKNEGLIQDESPQHRKAMANAEAVCSSITAEHVAILTKILTENYSPGKTRAGSIKLARDWCREENVLSGDKSVDGVYERCISALSRTLWTEVSVPTPAPPVGKKPAPQLGNPGNPG